MSKKLISYDTATGLLPALVDEALNAKIEAQAVVDSSTYGRKNFIEFATAGGPPSQGAHVAGELLTDQQGAQWLCVASGTPGTFVTPGLDLSLPKPLDTLPSDYCDYRVYPAIPTTDGAMVKDRAYAVPLPVPDRVSISKFQYNIQVIGQAGAVVRFSVYSDHFGYPDKLLGEVTGPGDVLGRQIITLPTPIYGGRWLWIASSAQNCATTAPQVTRLGYTPWINTWTNWNATTGAVAAGMYQDAITGAMPAVWPGNRGANSKVTETPWFMVGFASNRLTVRETLPDRTPVLRGDSSWELDCVQEPDVHWDGSQWVLMYHGGQGAGTTRIGYATAPTIDGPWTKQGYVPGDGIAGATGRASSLLDGGNLYVYFDSHVVSGTGITTLGADSTSITLPNGGVTQVTNSSVINDGGTYRMIFDGRGTGDGGYWKSGYATATSPLGPFTVVQFPLALGLTMNGGPCLTKVGAVFNLWFHGGVGNLPNDIFHATSSDCITWTTEPAARIRRKHRLEVDQIADPNYVVDPSTGIGYLFWDAIDNGTPLAASIMRSVPQVMPIAP